MNIVSEVYREGILRSGRTLYELINLIFVSNIWKDFWSLTNEYSLLVEMLEAHINKKLSRILSACRVSSKHSTRLRT